MTVPDEVVARLRAAGCLWAEDEAALLRLWREKRGEAEPEDLSGNLVVQLGLATEDLNRRWYEAHSGQVVVDFQRQIRHRALHWMGATLDGRAVGTLADSGRTSDRVSGAPARSAPR